MNDQSFLHIALIYLAVIRSSHTRSQLDAVIRHALQNDGYVGGWYNQENGLYYFDSTRLFPEDSLNQAVHFVKQQIKASYDLVVSKLPKKYGIK